jgi:hypothetical protein
VWRGVTHRGFIAQSSHGEAYVYPPRPDKRAKGVLKSASSRDQGWLVALSAKNLRHLDEHQGELEARELCSKVVDEQLMEAAYS